MYFCSVTLFFLVFQIDNLITPQMQKEFGEEVNPNRISIFTENSKMLFATQSAVETERFKIFAKSKQSLFLHFHFSFSFLIDSELLSKKYDEEELLSKERAAEMLSPLIANQGEQDTNIKRKRKREFFCVCEREGENNKSMLCH